MKKSSNTEKFVFGCEESHGYLFSDEIRDKDGIMAAVFFAEMATELKAENKTPLDLLEEIYQKYGYWKDNLKSYTLEGIQGQKKIATKKNSSASPMIFNFCENKLRKILQLKQGYSRKNAPRKKRRAKRSWKSQVFSFFLENGSRITARPSGTEPKIKFYLNLTGTNKKSLNELETTILKKIELLVKTAK